MRPAPLLLLLSQAVAGARIGARAGSRLRATQLDWGAADGRPMKLDRAPRAGTAGAPLAIAWPEVTGELWSSLVLLTHRRGKPDPATKIKEGEEKVIKTFVADCVGIFDTVDFALPDEVVVDMCERAGGASSECDSMNSTLWTAYEASTKAGDTAELESWCQETAAWFEEKTKPKCLQNCVAELCKTRCEVGDQLRDLEDEEAAYIFRMNQTLTAEAALNESRAEVDDCQTRRDDLKIECNEKAQVMVKINDGEIEGEMSEAEAVHKQCLKQLEELIEECGKKGGDLRTAEKELAAKQAAIDTDLERIGKEKEPLQAALASP